MRVEEVEKLLARYYEGNTDEHEEEALKAYFHTQDVPEHLVTDKKMFLCFRPVLTAEVPAGLEERLSRMIDEKEKKESGFQRKHPSKLNLRWVAGIAAGLILLVGMGYSISQHYDQPERPIETFTDPQVAYEVLQATLMEVSMGLNIGIDEVIDSRKEIKRTNWEIKQDLLIQ